MNSAKCVLHKYSVTLAYVLIAATFVVSLLAVATTSARTRYSNCISQRTFDQRMLSIIEQATAGNGVLDFSQIDGFNNLSTNEQAFWRNLTARLRANSGANSTVRQYAIATLPIPVCKKGIGL